MQNPFHKKGLTYFWALNDRCEIAELEPQLHAFAKAGTAAICLHPRPGLLLPYGGQDWFDFIRVICQKAAALDLDIWLYDEDPYPSGNAGGWIAAENPEFIARTITMHTFDPNNLDDPTLFCFPTGKLLWCGLIEANTNSSASRTIDLTNRVGMLRRQWRVWEHWDSRYFYPDTPLYHFPRADTRGLEFGLRAPTIPDGMKLVAFVAMPSGEDNTWGTLADTLNPACTTEFIKRTHERYRESVGDMFGKEIKAMFTDEAKFMSTVPWTPGMFEDFQSQHGFDLRPRLVDLFSQDNSERASITRILYRQWCNQRLISAWFTPVSQWCHKHNLFLVGHVSPEDDLVQQSDCVGNLFPIFPAFDLAGLDLIIPAVGDRRHPIINVGIVAATSVAQQRGMMGVMSESGACAGFEGTAEQLGHILKWQTVMGMTSPVIHCAYASEVGPRAMEYPPNYGPVGKLWPNMPRVHREIEQLQTHVWNKKQIAPVAILWPIRSFNMRNIDWLNDTTNMRHDFVALLQSCLDYQVGTHILDEADMHDAKIKNGALQVGQASYTHLLIPSSIAWHKKTIDLIRQAAVAGVSVQIAGQVPTHQHAGATLEPLDFKGISHTDIFTAVGKLPRLVNFAQDATDIRCTAWLSLEEPDNMTRLVINLRTEQWAGSYDGVSLKLQAGEVRVLESGLMPALR